MSDECKPLSAEEAEEFHDGEESPVPVHDNTIGHTFGHKE